MPGALANPYLRVRGGKRTFLGGKTLFSGKKGIISSGRERCLPMVTFTKTSELKELPSGKKDLNNNKGGGRWGREG